MTGHAYVPLATPIDNPQDIPAHATALYRPLKDQPFVITVEGLRDLQARRRRALEGMDAQNAERAQLLADPLTQGMTVSTRSFG